MNKNALKKNVACLTDGDPNEYLSFEYSAEKWGMGKHFLCSWHLTSPNWSSNVGKPANTDIVATKLFNIARDWIKTWFTTEILTITEFDYSVSKFFLWINSDDVIKSLGEKVSLIFFLD